MLSDRFNIVAKRYFIAKLPCVYLVGADGKVSMVNVGYNDDISRALLDNIRKAVGEPTTDPIPEQLAAHLGGQGAPEAVNVPAEQAVEETQPAAEPDGSQAAAAVAEQPAAKTKAKKGRGRKGKGRKGRGRRSR